MGHLPRKITKYFLLVAVVGILTLCGAGMAAAQTQTQTQTLKQTTATAVTPAPGYVGSETCATCHQEKADQMVEQSARQAGAPAWWRGRKLRELPRAR